MKALRFERETIIPLFFAFSFGMILSNLLAQQAQQPEAEPEKAVMVYKGIDMTMAQLPPDQAEQFKRLHETYLRDGKVILENAALTLYVNDYAKNNSLSFESAASELFNISPPSEDEIEAYFLAHQATIGKDYFEIKASIQKLLEQERIRAQRDTLLNQMKTKGDLAFLIN